MAASSHTQPSSSSDVLIAGAGIIGLSLALELRERGASVTVLERAEALGGATRAAAGMLAAEDPHNPPALLPFSRYSLSLYPAFLSRIEALSGRPVPFQTSSTMQYIAEQAYTLAERSLDPRQLGPALLAAARAAGVEVEEFAAIEQLLFEPSYAEARTVAGGLFRASHFVHTTGAWRLPGLPATLFPRKGQMLRVAMPISAPLVEVHRAEHIYVVPRLFGPQAGTALVGATLEDSGFDVSTSHEQLHELRLAAARLASKTEFVAEAPLVEAWAGVRPCTPDLLPLLGRLREREWIAAGHFRNGILLAPGTSAVMADLFMDKRPALDLALYSPQRFG